MCDMEKILKINVKEFGYVLNNILDGDVARFVNVLLALKDESCPFKEMGEAGKAWNYLNDKINDEPKVLPSRALVAYNKEGRLVGEYESINAAYRDMGASWETNRDIWLSAKAENEYVLAFDRIWRFRDSVEDKNGQVPEYLFNKNAK